jgi:inhibitor of KinA
MELKRKYEIVPLGDAALLVNFEQKIEEAINSAIINLADAIRRADVEGVINVQPAYCSLAVKYDSRKLNFSSVEKIIHDCSDGIFIEKEKEEGKVWSIPVCYEPEFAWDISDLSQFLKLSVDEIIELHTASLFRVFMMGFLPGFPYLGKLPQKLKCKRKDVPRKIVPAQSVGLAGEQTGIYPISAPGGWQIIGKTPIKIFDSSKRNPFLFKAGDSLKFNSISKKEFYSIEAEVESGTFNFNSLYV